MLHLASNMRQMGHLARGVYTPVTGPFGGHATLGDGLIAYWKFDEESGTTANDELDGNDGTNTGATVNQTGKIAKCYKYVDSTDFVDFGTLADLWDGTNDEATFSFWFKSDDISVGQHYCIGKFSAYPGENFRGLYARVNSSAGDGKILVYIGDTGATNLDYWTTNSGYLTADNTWYHVVVTLNLGSNTCQIYVNADSKANTVTSSGSNITTFASNAITYKVGRIRLNTGAYSGITNGYVDEHGIWNRILTSDEITDLYNSGSGLTY